MSANEPKRTFNATKLTPGKTYRVIAAFTDYDGQIHKIGESWRFIEHNFVPYEDGLTISIERDGQKSAIRMQWRPEAQEDTIDNFSDFVEEV
jgi:hypothetical protein